MDSDSSFIPKNFLYFSSMNLTYMHLGGIIVLVAMIVVAGRNREKIFCFLDFNRYAISSWRADALGSSRARATASARRNLDELRPRGASGRYRASVHRCGGEAISHRPIVPHKTATRALDIPAHADAGRAETKALNTERDRQ